MCSTPSELPSGTDMTDPWVINRTWTELKAKRLRAASASVEGPTFASAS